MTDSSKTHITVVVDRSGSMQSTKSDAEGGINAFLKAQYEAPGTTTCTIVEFDDKIDTVCSFATECPTYRLNPRGSTALRDAIGYAVTRTGESLRIMSEDNRPGKVYLVVVTDGFENASREWSQTQINALLKQQQEKYSWEVVFLAADPTAVQTGIDLGFRAASSIQYSGTHTVAAYDMLNNSILLSRSAGAPVAFTAEDRNAAVTGSATTPGDLNTPADSSI